MYHHNRGLSDVTGRTAYQLTVGGRVYEIRPFPMNAVVEMELYLRRRAAEDVMRIAAASAAMVPRDQVATYWEQVFRTCHTLAHDSPPSLSAKDNLAAALWAGLYAAHRHEFPAPDAPNFQEWMTTAIEEHGWDKLAAILKTYCQLDVNSDDSNGKKATNLTGAS